MSLRDLAVHERAVDDAAFKGIHGFQHHFPAGAVRLFRKTVGERDESLAAFRPVILAVHDDLRRAVALLPYVSAGEELYRVKHFPSVTDGGTAVLALDVHDDLAVTLLRLAAGFDVHGGEHAVDEILRERLGGLFESHSDFRPLKESPFLQHFHPDTVSRGFEFGKCLFDGKLDIACLDNNRFFHFVSYYLRGASAPVFFASRLSSSLPTRVNPSWNTMDTSELVKVYSANAAE